MTRRSVGSLDQGSKSKPFDPAQSVPQGCGINWGQALRSKSKPFAFAQDKLLQHPATNRKHLLRGFFSF